MTDPDTYPDNFVVEDREPKLAVEEFYTDAELEMFRQQLRDADAAAKEAWRKRGGPCLHPLIAAARAEISKFGPKA